MAISGELTNELRQFLQYHLKDKNDYKTYLILLFGTNNPIVNNINWDTAVNNIVPNIIDKLDVYGKIPNSGQTAIIKFLSLIINDVGINNVLNTRLVQKIIKEQEQQAIIELKDILQPLEKQYLQQIQKSYSLCASGNFSDWLPDNIEGIFNQLQHIHEREASLQTIFKFVAILLIIHQFPHHVNQQLQQWGENNTDNFSQICKQTKQEIKHKQENIQRYLIILIEPSIQEADNSLYIVKSWVIEDLMCISLDITYQKKEKFSFKEIPNLLSYLIQQSIQQLKNVPTTIEFFLPHELFNQAVDAFIPEKFDDDDDDLPVPICIDYNVSIRSYQRIKKLLRKKYLDEKIILWQEKWRTLNSRSEEICFPYFISGDNWQEIFAELKSDNAVGLKLFQVPSKEILKAIDQTGTPIALWLRTKSKNLDFMTDFEAILQDCSIAKLQKRIKDERLEGFGQEIHIGKHITLLWDNPNILPPEILPASLPQVLD